MLFREKNEMTNHMKRICASSFTASITLTVIVFIVFICKDHGQAMEEETTIDIICEKTNKGTVLENSTYDKSLKRHTFKHLRIAYCPQPQNSYFEYMNQIGVNATILDTLYLVFDKKHPVPLNADRLRGLNITRLTIIYSIHGKYPSDDYDTQILSIDFLDPLMNLQDLHIYGVQMPGVPEWSRIKSVHFGRGVSLGTFGGCDYLEEVTITKWVVQVYDWLASCTKLKRLTMQYMSNVSALKAVSDAKNLQYLTMRKCNLKILKRKFFDLLPDLKELDLSDNNLIFPSYSNFREDLWIKDVAMLLRMLPKLRILNLSWNRSIYIFCEYNLSGMQNKNIFSTGIEHPLLEILVLRGTKTTTLCTAVGALPSLTYLALGGPSEAPSIMELLVSTQPLQVHFDGYIKNIEFTETDYDILLTNKNNLSATNLITLYAKLELDCDCHHALFAKALREELVNVKSVHCLTHNTDLTLVPSKLLECERFTCGNTKSSHTSCVCRRMYEDNATTIDCRGKIVSEIPYVPNVNVIEVIAPQNLIQALRQQDLPDTLMILDLTYNHITHIDEEQAITLFSKPERRMNLSGNPIICDCGNRAFIETIKQHHSQVEDYYNLTCTGGVLLINDVNTKWLCLKLEVDGNRDVMAFLIAGALIALGLLVRTLYYRYKTMICIYLYARGWCLCCIRENSLNADRPYDAFVSFCHADESLVSEQLVPQLEERGFIICVHYRDWVPGELIPTQIVRSVEASRRTIIVLSRSFLQSMWGLLEFRIAHVRALKDGIARIILIVIDDVVDEDALDGDLRSYVTSSTYVRWDDPWFWDKLKYAMPHNNQQTRTDDVGLNVRREYHAIPFSIDDRSAQ